MPSHSKQVFSVVEVSYREQGRTVSKTNLGRKKIKAPLPFPVGDFDQRTNAMHPFATWYLLCILTSFWVLWAPKSWPKYVIWQFSTFFDEFKYFSVMFCLKKQVNALIAFPHTSCLQAGYYIQGRSNKMLQRKEKLLPCLKSGITFHFCSYF